MVTRILDPTGHEIVTGSVVRVGNLEFGVVTIYADGKLGLQVGRWTDDEPPRFLFDQMSYGIRVSAVDVTVTGWNDPGQQYSRRY